MSLSELFFGEPGELDLGIYNFFVILAQMRTENEALVSYRTMNASFTVGRPQTAIPVNIA